MPNWAYLVIEMKDIFLLDADETLLDFRRGEREQLEKTLRSLGVDFIAEMFFVFHEINDGLWKKLERGETTRAVLVVERFRILFERFRIKADEKEAAERYYESMKNSCYLLDGAEEFLKRLKARGRIFIVTNGSKKVQRARLAGSGILKYADGVFISEDVGADKPAKKYAEYVEEHIQNYARERAVWLGDSLTSDMPCAVKQGIDFVLFAKERPEGYQGKIAASYAEAEELFETM